MSWDRQRALYLHNSENKTILKYRIVHTNEKLVWLLKSNLIIYKAKTLNEPEYLLFPLNKLKIESLCFQKPQKLYINATCIVNCLF